MRIEYIGGAYIPSREANSMHQMRMCHALASLGHDVVLHARRGKEAVEDDFAHYGVTQNFRLVKHERPQIRVYGAIVNAWHVANHISGRNLPDVFYGREIYGLTLAAHTGVPFMFESHWRPKHFVQKRLEQRLFRTANFRGVVFISEALRGIYRQMFPWLPADRTLVAHDAADPVKPAPAQSNPNERLRVGYVGGFLEGYGLDLIRRLALAAPQHDFEIVGGKPDELEAFRTACRGVGNIKLHGFVAPAALPDLYSEFDVVLAPYQHDTAHIQWISPMKLFEYMAHGKAIICSDFPVMREVLEPDKDAVLVRSDHLPSWLTALERMRSSEFRTTLGQTARLKFEAQFTWRIRAERVLQVLHSSPSATGPSRVPSR